MPVRHLSTLYKHLRESRVKYCSWLELQILLTFAEIPIAHLQYSFSLTTFSPSGKLVQIEYALNAVNGGSTSLGIKATNGVVIATEKKLRSTLIDETTVQKISLLTPNIGVAYSGMGPDSRLLVRKARKSAQVMLCLN